MLVIIISDRYCKTNEEMTYTLKDPYDDRLAKSLCSMKHVRGPFLKFQDWGCNAYIFFTHVSDIYINDNIPCVK